MTTMTTTQGGRAERTSMTAAVRRLNAAHARSAKRNATRGVDERTLFLGREERQRGF
jgi:hypothetical protein